MSKRPNISPVTIKIALLVVAIALLGGAVGVCARALSIRATAHRALELAATLDKVNEEPSPSDEADGRGPEARGRGTRTARGPNRPAGPTDRSTTETTPTLAADAGSSATTATAPAARAGLTTATATTATAATATAAHADLTGASVAAGPTRVTLTTRTEARASSPTTFDGDTSAARNPQSAIRNPQSSASPRPPGASSRSSARTGGSRSGGSGGSGVPFPEKLTALLKSKKIFGAPAQPGVSVQGVLGNGAFINNQYVQVGSSNGPVKLLEVYPDKVVVEVDGQRRELPIWQAMPGSQSRPTPPTAAPPPTRGAPTPPPASAPAQSAPTRGGRIIVRYQGKEVIIDGNKIIADGQTMEMPEEQIAEMLKQIPSDAVVIRE